MSTGGSVERNTRTDECNGERGNSQSDNVSENCNGFGLGTTECGESVSDTTFFGESERPLSEETLRDKPNGVSKSELAQLVNYSILKTNSDVQEINPRDRAHRGPVSDFCPSPVAVRINGERKERKSVTFNPDIIFGSDGDFPSQNRSHDPARALLAFLEGLELLANQKASLGRLRDLEQKNVRGPVRAYRPRSPPPPPPPPQPQPPQQPRHLTLQERQEVRQMLRSQQASLPQSDVSSGLKLSQQELQRQLQPDQSTMASGTPASASDASGPLPERPAPPQRPPPPTGRPLWIPVSDGTYAKADGSFTGVRPRKATPPPRPPPPRTAPQYPGEEEGWLTTRSRPLTSTPRRPPRWVSPPPQRPRSPPPPYQGIIVSERPQSPSPPYGEVDVRRAENAVRVVVRSVVPTAPPPPPPRDEGYGSEGSPPTSASDRGVTRPHSVSPFMRSARQRVEQKEEIDEAVSCLLDFGTRDRREPRPQTPAPR
uniref:Basic salivary proline-rich protein 1-like n=1 Tax=Crassostrea virginica TaxID=6565 RepID=A0A8B8CB95_CRAVI|nr:basic salivary proline-rich protein 1-like [Crassostrea virginica]